MAIEGNIEITQTLDSSQLLKELLATQKKILESAEKVQKSLATITSTRRFNRFLESVQKIGTVAEETGDKVKGVIDEVIEGTSETDTELEEVSEGLEDIQLSVREVTSEIEDVTDKTDEWRDALDKTEKAAKKVSSTLKRVMGAVGIGLTLNQAIRLSDDFSESMAQLQNAIRLAQPTANQIKSFEDFTELAASNFGIDRASMNDAIAMLLRLSGSGGAVDILKKSMIDMSIATGNSIENVAQLLGRTMQIGLSALTRYGIVATEEQRRQWDAFGNDMEARANFLNEMLQSRFGEAAEQLGNSIAGRWKIAKTALKEALVDVGTQLIPALTGVINSLLAISNLVGGLPNLIMIVLGAMATYKIASMALMAEEEVRALGLIGRWIAAGAAKLFYINPLLGIGAAAAASAAMIGLAYGVMQLFGGASISGGSVPQDNGNSNKDPETNIKIVLEQNENGEWVQTQVKRNGVNDNVNYYA